MMTQRLSFPVIEEVRQMSGKVIMFQDRRVEKAQKIQEDKDAYLQKDINYFLKQLIEIKKDFRDRNEGLGVYSKDEMGKRMSKCLIVQSTEQGLIDSGVYLCGEYISRMLNDSAKSRFDWIAADYLERFARDGNPRILKEGGDMCFILVGLFPERGRWRLMEPSYYEKMGKGLYYKFYTETGNEIGYHMSRHFPVMIQFTQRCLRLI